MLNVCDAFASDLFQGRQIVVSGGTSGIGLSIARAFATLQGAVIATGTSLSKLASETANPANKGIAFTSLDVRDPEAVEAFFSSLKQADVLVNCAGAISVGDEESEESFVRVVDINLNGVMRMSRAAKPLLLHSQGCIINIASLLSFFGNPGAPAYTASKTGLLGLTRSLALDLGPSGVRVNAVAPGYHRTDMCRPLLQDSTVANAIASRAALKRWGEPEDVAGAVIYLASPAARFVTGVCLPTDGGYSISI